MGQLILQLELNANAIPRVQTKRFPTNLRTRFDSGGSPVARQFEPNTDVAVLAGGFVIKVMG